MSRNIVIVGGIDLVSSCSGVKRGRNNTHIVTQGPYEVTNSLISTALQLIQHGCNVKACSLIGRDELGTQIETTLDRNDVNISGIHIAPKEETRSTCIISRKNSTIVCTSGITPNNQFVPNFNTDRIVEDCHFLHTNGELPGITGAVINAAQTQSIPISMELNQNSDPAITTRANILFLCDSMRRKLLKKKQIQKLKYDGLGPSQTLIVPLHRQQTCIMTANGTEVVGKKGKKDAEYSSASFIASFIKTHEAGMTVNAVIEAIHASLLENTND